jgi:hypothetical protein
MWVVAALKDENMKSYGEPRLPTGWTTNEVAFGAGFMRRREKVYHLHDMVFHGSITLLPTVAVDH